MASVVKMSVTQQDTLIVTALFPLLLFSLSSIGMFALIYVAYSSKHTHECSAFSAGPFLAA